MNTLLSMLGSWAGAPSHGFDAASGRSAWLAVLSVLALYLVTSAIVYPSVITVTDEASYIRDARVVLTGQGGIPVTDPFSGRVVVIEPAARYPLGTALMMAPFVGLADWRGAYVVPLLCVAIGVLLTGLWLRDAERSPFYAMVVLGYPATLVMGRIAMSDAPSLAVCAVGLFCFWRGRDGPFPWFLSAGLMAGASILFRESNVLVFVPLFVGALLRRDSGVWALVVGGVVGMSLRVVANQLVFGDPFFYKAPDPFRLEAVLTSAPIYLASLLVLVPGGLIAGLAYRGERRPEIVATVILFTLFYCLYGYSAAESGLAKRLILGPRYFLPLLPVLALCLADGLPRLHARLGEGAGRALLLALGAWALSVALVNVAVPVGLDRWNSGQAEIRDEIERNVPAESVLVTNSYATGKFLDVLDRPLPPMKHDAIGNREMAALLRRHGEVYVALLDRSDSAFWQRQAQENELYIGTLRPRPDLVFDRQVTSTDRLRVWRVAQRQR